MALDVRRCQKSRGRGDLRRNFLPGMFAYLATIRDQTATPEARGQATAALIVEAVAILMIA